MTRIGIMTSSTRPTRVGPKVAAWVAEQAPEGVETDIVDLGELNLPFLADEEMPSKGDYDQPTTVAWAEQVRSYDALILVVGQYNSGYTAPLKNAIDTLYAEWAAKPVGMVGYGFSGAANAMKHLTDVLARVKMKVVDVAWPSLFFGRTLQSDGTVLDGAPVDLTVELYDALVEAATSPGA